MSPRDRILREGATILGQLGSAPDRIVVDVSSAGTKVVISGTAPETAPSEELTPPMDAPQHWKWLSPVEEAILAVATADYQPAEQLAQKAGLPKSADLLPILRNMVERQILESAQGRGFRLRQAPEPR